ncbi:uncharacterized protein DS421_9g259430 [Arachis hypogaea]|nr:uncharacterized protein DS421_9g259430 [Arachis hypogaea]
MVRSSGDNQNDYSKSFRARATYCEKENDGSGAAALTTTSSSGDGDSFTDSNAVWRQIGLGGSTVTGQARVPSLAAELPRGSASSLPRLSLLTKLRCAAGSGKEWQGSATRLTGSATMTSSGSSLDGGGGESSRAT